MQAIADDEFRIRIGQSGQLAKAQPNAQVRKVAHPRLLGGRQRYIHQ
jgi:hypothetical protein